MAYKTTCDCGHPYSIEYEGDSPWKDKFSAKCPTCGKIHQEKVCAIDVIWTFEPNWKKPIE